MIGRAIGTSIAEARDAMARGLVRLGVGPNLLTFMGIIITLGAGICYALAPTKGKFAPNLDPTAPANGFLLLAGGLLLLACACDMLDGAVARIGGKKTLFGAFLDSSIDRIGDFAVYAGIAAFYARREPANVTFVVLSMVASFNAFMISYTRARAEDLIESCSVGYWQRGERSAAILIATFAHNIPALVLQQAILPAFTVYRRMTHTRAVLAGKSPVTDPRRGTLLDKVRMWRWKRMTVPYDFVTALNIAWLLLARFDADNVFVW